MPSFNSPGASFGGSFAAGLAQVLQHKQNQDQLLKQRQIDNTWKSMQFLLDSGQVNDVADLQPHFDTLTQLGAFGNPKATKKGQATPQDNVVKILGHVLSTNQQPLAPTGGGKPQQAPAPVTGPDDAGNMMPEQAPLASTPLQTPAAPAQHRSLNGIPLLTPDEALTNKVGREGTTTMARIDLARNRILPALKAVESSASLDDALAAVGVRLPTSTFHNQSVAGEITNPDGTTTPAFGIFTGRGYVDYQTGQPLENFMPRTSTGSRSLGTGVEVAARQLFGKPASQLNPSQMAQAEELANDQAGAKADVTARGRVGGAGAAQMNVPLTAEQAQKLPGAAVGDTSADFAGQQAPTQEQGDLQRTVGYVKDTLDHVRDLVQILPSQSELGSLAPGAWIEAQKRTPAGRVKFARLESALGNIVTTLNRSINESKGAQSDQDIMRAYQTLVDIQTSLLSPTKGDTYESALARLDETMKALDKKSKSIPGLLTKPGATPAATTTTTPKIDIAQPGRTGKPTTGADAVVPGLFIDKDGNLVRKP